LNRTPRFIGFYLPQFHPIPENDRWWGAGFTEWTNVRKALPQFPGHHQPREPGELGYYDLRDPGVRQAQSDLALSHGIDGFCYYHYWFRGNRLLEDPFDAVRASGAPEIPFCLCWANEDWTRRWDGSDSDVLVSQQYSFDDDLAHIRWLIEAFKDQRYIRHQGRPLFLVYRASRLPRPKETVALWRRECVAAGQGDPFLCSVESFREEHITAGDLGFDATVIFQPDWTRVGPPTWRRLAQAAGRRLGMPRLLEPVYSRVEYRSVVAEALGATRQDPDLTRFPCVIPGWDNTPRRQRGIIVIDNESPEAYERWVAETWRKSHSDLIFVNAWNEWGEGCAMEPSERWGRAFLEAHQRAVRLIASEA
jgi:hypothetical protein